MNIFVRLLPAATPELGKIYDKILEASFDKEKAEEKLNFDGEAKEYFEHDSIGVRFPLYMEMNRKFFLEETQFLSLPTCYIRVNERRLYLSSGNICITPTRNEVEKLLKEEIKKEIMKKSPNREILDEEIQEKMAQYKDKLDQYFEMRDSEKGSEIFITTTLADDAKEKLYKIKILYHLRM